MSTVLEFIWRGLKDSFLMGWEIWWALVLGFTISAIVQAWVPRERIERSLSGSGLRPMAWATGLGAASSSCSYAAVAIGKSLFEKGASAASSLVFTLASTNLVWELGLVLWVLIGWQFTLAEYIGGVVMIALIALLARGFIPVRLEARARERARRADPGHVHHSSSRELPWRARLLSVQGWTDVAANFRSDWRTLWKEITVGLLLAGFAAQLSTHVFQSLFVRGAAQPLRTIENVLAGPAVAVLSSVCSVGNVPLAAVLWSGGISFAGVLAFLFADLIVLPILAIYRKYYGASFAWRISALMLVAMVGSALAVSGLFDLLGAIPHGARPSRAAIFGAIRLDYKLVLNVVALIGFAALLTLRARPSAGGADTSTRFDQRSSFSADGSRTADSVHRARHTPRVSQREP